jgi:hypothetical protein
VADDPAFDLIGANVVGFGTAFLNLEGRDSPIFEQIEQLISWSTIPPPQVPTVVGGFKKAS